jgi:hypothetical protein
MAANGGWEGRKCRSKTSLYSIFVRKVMYGLGFFDLLTALRRSSFGFLPIPISCVFFFLGFPSVPVLCLTFSSLLLCLVCQLVFPVSSRSLISVFPVTYESLYAYSSNFSLFSLLRSFSGFPSATVLRIPPPSAVSFLNLFSYSTASSCLFFDLF